MTYIISIRTTRTQFAIIGFATLLLTSQSARAWQDAPTAPTVTSDDDVKTVNITSKRQAVQTDIDRKVYNVSNDLQSVNGNAADVLNTIPSVQVDADGNVSLRGDNRIVILVDGKPSAQLSGSNAGDGLLQYSGNDIEKIEVMTNAPAEYAADGTAGVINIITKKNRQPGSTGAFMLNAGNDRRFVSDLSGAMNTHDVKLSGGIGLREDVRQRNIVTNVATPATGVVPAEISNENLNENARRLMPSLKGALAYRINEDQTLDVDFKLRQRSGYRYYNVQDVTQFASSSDGAISSDSFGHSDGHEWSLSGEQRLSFKQNLGSPDEALELSLHRTSDKERERYFLDTYYTIPEGQTAGSQTFQNHNFITDDFSMDYRNQISADKSVKLGYSFKHDSDNFDFTDSDVYPASGLLVPGSLQDNQFRYLQTIQAVYGSYQQTLGVWQILAGLREEQTDSQGDQLGSNQTFQHNYAGLYPSLHMEQQLDAHSILSFVYSKRLSRPDPEDLNPYIDYRDPQNLQAGNPNLLPQQSQSLEAGYRVETERQNYGITGYLKKISDSFTVETTLISPGVLLTTKANIPSAMSAGFELATDGPVTSALSYRVSSNLFYMQVEDTAPGAQGLASTTGINLKSSLDYRADAVDTAQVSFNRTDKQLTAQGYVAAINLVNVGYKRQLRSNLSLVATISDLFNGQRQLRYVNTSAMNETYSRFQEGRLVYVGINYTFGVSKKMKSEGFEYDQP